MAGKNEDEMESILRLADEISDDFQNGINQIQTLKSQLNAEIQNRQALELNCSTLTRENDRLKNLHLQALTNLTIHLQQRGNSHGLAEKLNKITQESLEKEEEYRKAIETMKQSHEEKIRVLEGQIREISSQKSKELLKKDEEHRDLIQSMNQHHEEKIRVLEGQIREISSKKTEEFVKKDGEHRGMIESMNRSHEEKIRVLEGEMREILNRKREDEAVIYQLHHEMVSYRNRLKEVDLKYKGEIEDLKDCIFVEQHEKEELSKKVVSLEKELLVTKTKVVDQSVCSSDKQLDLMKQKLMKLRKENEVLKRQLNASKDS